MELIFVGDPMCSWCYGFGKELSELTARFPQLPLRIVVGGLRAGATDVLDDAGKRMRLQHWARVEQASGLPFNRQGLLDRTGFVYDTEPICRAVVTARDLAPEADLLAVFRALQHAFYVDALDTTDGHVLAEAGSKALSRLGVAVSADAFLARWQAPEIQAQAQADFALARSWNIRSFPALLLRIGNALHSIADGYSSAEMLERHVNAVLEETAASAGT
ncbi:DsbA family protein [Cupriavidus neocaledonicus]|uniref:Thioredoxin n=1 Tax=Cupriavidus neocaledonicus TaxID=1040979 RepID=A0A375HP05_9BURK|nr:DsbA family protein [Cupriavidus neocaledonicus]SOZ39223.1 Thioredoxin-like fold protein [Cupriavidus neocaledonicus]SPD59103.1 Thioredoxin [Cupriavidus neocaledonicus]